jgi:hypothetical protein
LGPFWACLAAPRAAWLARPCELHEHPGAWLQVQARPGFFKPRAPSAMARAWPFQKASGCEGAVLESGERAPLARKVHKEKITHSDQGHEISPVVSAPFVCGWQFDCRCGYFFCGAPPVCAGPAVYTGTCRGRRGSCIYSGACISTPAASLTNPIPLGSIPGSRASLSSVLVGISKPATPHKKLRALG